MKRIYSFFLATEGKEIEWALWPQLSGLYYRQLEGGLRICRERYHIKPFPAASLQYFENPSLPGTNAPNHSELKIKKG
jgi:hypothetical protein